ATDPLGRITEVAYDDAGRIVSRTLPDGATVAYDRDARGFLSALHTPGGAAYAMEFSPRGHLLRLELPDVGSGTDAFLFERDDEDRLVRVQRPDGRQLDLSYDAGGHLTGIAGVTSTEDLTFSYDAASGHLSTAASPEVTATFTHDGLLLTEEGWSGAVSGTVAFDYDDRLRLSSMTIAGSAPIAFAYDDDDLMTAAGDLSILRTGPLGMPTQGSLGQLEETLAYDQFGALSDLRVTGSQGELLHLAYEYDGIGRITQVTETIEGAAHVDQYHYDAGGRLVEVLRDGQPYEAASYDPDGNRTSYTGPGVGTVVASFDGRGRILSQGAATYGHAPSGERTEMTDSSGTTSYVYDALGR
ncbi:MAG: hypothetical protein D6760_06450, partial [Deltaproteobacteria bacterium]